MPAPTPFGGGTPGVLNSSFTIRQTSQPALQQASRVQPRIVPRSFSWLEIVNSVNTTVTNLGMGSYTVVKTGGANFNWDALAVSLSPINGSIRLRILPSEGHSKFGISTAPGTAEYSANYAFQFGPSGSGVVYRSESPSTTTPFGSENWTLGVPYWLDYDSALAEVKLYTGADFATATLLHTWSSVPAGPYYFDGQAYNTNGGAEVLFWETVPAPAMTVGYSLTADAGVFTFTGQSAGLLLGLAMPAANASFSYTGQAALLERGYTMSAALGTFGYTGQSALLERGYAMTGGQATFSYTGQAAGTLAAYKMPAGLGTFSYSGQAALLERGYAMPVTVGTFTYSGQAAALLPGISIVAGLGTFSYTGQSITFGLTATMSAGMGAFSYTGQNARALFNMEEFPEGVGGGGPAKPRVSAFFLR